MFSPGPVTGHPSGKGKEKEDLSDPPRGRSGATEEASPSDRCLDKRTDSRSVSRGRTHRRSHPGDRRGDRHRTANHPAEAFVYPCPTGGFSPRGRPPTTTEAAYLSDAPHLDYMTPSQGKKRTASGMVKSPQASHIRMEMEAGMEVARARGGAAEMPEGAREGSGKRERD